MKAIADTISSGITLCKHVNPVKKTITFVKTGEKVTPVARNTFSGLLSIVQDWELQVDLGKELNSPETVAILLLRPDMVLISKASYQIIHLELTVPCEDRIEEANERKRTK